MKNMKFILLVISVLLASVQGYCSEFDSELMCDEEMPRKTAKRPVPSFNEEPPKKAKPVIQSTVPSLFSGDLQKMIIAEMCALPDWLNLSRTCQYFHNLLGETLQKKVLIMGPTGVGKSALIHLLLGKTLVAKEDVFGTRYQLTPTEKVPNVNISNTLSQSTYKLAVVLDLKNKRTIIDCPGFTDRLEQEHVNAQALCKFLKDNVSVVLVMSATYDPAFEQLMKKMTEIFPDQTQLKAMLSLVVSKQKDMPSVTEYLKKRLTPHAPRSQHQVQYFMDRHIEMGAPLAPQIREVVQHLVEHPNRTVNFRCPVGEGPYPPIPELQSLLGNCEYVQNPTIKAPVRERGAADDRDRHQHRTMIGYTNFCVW